MPESTNENATRKAPPYVPFKTFLSAIESLEQGVPNQIDRSVLSSCSGVVQGQLLASLKFLGLIDEQGVPQKVLHELVEMKESRKSNLGRILENAYSDIFALNLVKMSPKQLEDAIENYGVTRATLRKALAFFLKAARYAELPLSPLFKRKTRESSPRKKRNGSAQARRSQAETNPPAEPQSGQGETKTINLRSGGSLTLILSVKFIEMEQEDRNFVFDLLDKLRAYERKEETAS